MTRKVIGALDVEDNTAAGEHLNLTPRSGAPGVNNTLFVDSADGYKLKFTNNSGDSSVVGNVKAQTYISILENALNYDNSQTVRYEPSYMETNPMDSDNADVKTNWTYDGTTDEYRNQQTSAASLEFDNLLSDDQKALLTTDTKKIMVIEKGIIWRDVVQDFAIIPNASFENATGSPFDNWATTGAAPTQDGSYIVTDGSFCAYWAMSYNTTPSGRHQYGTLTQSIDVTNVDAVTADIRGWNNGAGSPSSLTWIRLTVGSASEEESFQAETTSTLFVDVRHLTGIQTITIKIDWQQFQSGFGTRTGRAGIDNLRVIKSDGAYTDTTRVTSISPDGGSTWVSITPGELTELATPLTDLGIKIDETRTTADATLYNTVSGYGVYWEDA